MQHPTPRLLPAVLGLALAAGALAGPASLSAATIKASINRTGPQNVSETWFVVRTTDEGFYVSAQESGANARLLPYAQVAAISFTEPETWADAQAAFDVGSYADAARRFAKLAEDYTNIASYEDSYGARARYYEIESYRRAGNYDKMNEAVDKLTASPVKLSATYQDQLKLFTMWGYAGKERWRGLADALSEYQTENAGGTANPTAPPIKPLRASIYTQVVYLRGLVNEHTDNSGEALNDYTRVIAMNFNTERSTVSDSILRALAILKDHPDIEESTALKGEAYALTVAFKTIYGDAPLPTEFAPFENPPPKEETKATEVPENAGAAPPQPPAEEPAPEVDLEAAEDPDEPAEDPAEPAE